MNDSHAISPRLTVVTLVRTDAAGLTATLESIETAADEIIVVDAGSNDNSREMARQFGAHVLDFEWCDDYSAARNYGLANATGDWVLWLDSGETLFAGDAAALRDFVQKTPAQTQAFMLVLQLSVSQRVIAAEQIAQIRLIPRSSAIRFAGRVRESLFESVSNLDLELEGLPWRIRRPVSDNDAKVKEQRAKQDLRLAELEIAEVGRLPQLLNCVADAAQALGDTQAAVAHYTETLRTETASTGDRLEAYYGLLACLDHVPDGRSSQLSLCVQALEHFPLDAQLLCAMGGYLQQEGRLDLAIRAYETAFRFGRINPLVWHLEEITAIAAVCHSGALQLQGDDEAALRVLQEALQRDGAMPRLHRALMDLHIKLGQTDEALTHVDGLGIDGQLRGPLSTAVRGACLAMAKDLPAAASYLQSAYDAGCHDVTCLRWLAVVQHALGNVEDAQSILDHWQQLDPANGEIPQLLQSIQASTLAASGPDKPVATDVRVDSRAHSSVGQQHQPLPAPSPAPH